MQIASRDSSKTFIMATLLALVMGLALASALRPDVDAVTLNPGTSYHIVETGSKADSGAFIKYSVTTEHSFTVKNSQSQYGDYSMQNDAWIYDPPCGPGVYNCPTWIQSTVRIDAAQNVGKSSGWYPISGGLTEAENGNVYQSFCTWSNIGLYDVSQFDEQVETYATISYNLINGQFYWVTTYQVYVLDSSGHTQTSWSNTCIDVWAYTNFDDVEGLTVGAGGSESHVTFYPLNTNPIFYQYIDLYSSYNTMSYSQKGSETGESSNLYMNPFQWNLENYNSGYLYYVMSYELTESAT